MSNAIPLRLLIHTIEVKHNFGLSDCGDIKSYDISVINNVRVDKTIGAGSADVGVYANGSATLYIDLVNSKGLDFEIKGKDLVLFDGDEFEVQSIKTCYDTKSKPHHLEVTLTI